MVGGLRDGATAKGQWPEGPTYLERGVRLGLVGGLDGGVLRAEELEGLRHGGHRAGSARDLNFQLVDGVGALRLVPVRQPLDEELELLLQQLIFLVLWQRKGEAVARNLRVPPRQECHPSSSPLRAWQQACRRPPAQTGLVSCQT